MSEKLQKILAGAGLGSRREIEQWISDGRISINGKTAMLGERITPEAHVRIDGKEVRLNPHKPPRTRVLLYHKPEGEICSRHDPEERPSVFDHLPLLRNGRWVSIGRLDFNTSGVLLFTNDGELANRLMHPSANIEREYAVRIQGQVSPAMLTALKKGVKLEDGLASFSTLSDQGGEGSNHWYHVTVQQGRNRVVRRLFESQGVMVSRLIRIRFGNQLLPRLLRRGKWAELTPDEIARLTSAPAPARPSRDARGVRTKQRSTGSRGQAAGRRDEKRSEFRRDSKPGEKSFRSRKDAAPRRDDRGPRTTQRPTGSRGLAAGRRDERQAPGRRDEKRSEFRRDSKPGEKSFHSRKDAAPRRDDRGAEKRFESRRDTKPSGRRARGKPSETSGKAPGLRERFSTQAPSRNKITRWEKFPGTTTRPASSKPRPASKKPARPAARKFSNPQILKLGKRKGK